MTIWPTIIQGGMGAAISNWRLAKAVSKEGQLGVVSGTALATVFSRILQGGDPGGHARRAIEAFPIPEIARRVFDKYYIPGGKKADESYKRHAMYTAEPAPDLTDLTIVSGFAEVFLAKEGHNGVIGINVLEKIQLPNLAMLYGAMLAGVSCVIIGAGIPIEIPGVLDALAKHEEVSIRLNVENVDRGDVYRTKLDPVAMGYGDLPELERPDFFTIISSNVLATAMLKRATGRVDGFVVETPTAGGHNAPPRGALKLNSAGEPIYGEKDAVDLAKLAELGLPFWLAGSYGSPEQLKHALECGAQGIQVGTAFAFCEESGMVPEVKAQVLELAAKGQLKIYTDPKASPTGFPFKVVELEGTMWDDALFQERERCCDLGYLRHPYKKENGTLGYRCPSEPVALYMKKGGKAEDIEGRKCLCNGLSANAGYAQVQKGGYLELPLVTAGDDIVNVTRFMKNSNGSYTAHDVIEQLLSGTIA